MVADRIEKFILRLKDKTQERKLRWKVLSQYAEWDRIKEEIEKSVRVNLKNFYIDDEKSYCLNKNNGYVIVLYVRYSKAPIFSPALDKFILLVKLNDDFPPENLSTYNSEDGYNSLLFELIEVIDKQKWEEYRLPEYMYDFFDKILKEDENGRITDK